MPFSPIIFYDTNANVIMPFKPLQQFDDYSTLQAQVLSKNEHGSTHHSKPPNFFTKSSAKLAHTFLKPIVSNVELLHLLRIDLLLSLLNTI